MDEVRPRMSAADYKEFKLWRARMELGDDRNVLVIGDPHEPFCLDGYPEFCNELKVKYDCNIIIHIGDHIDNHFSSYHETDPDGFGGGDELDLCIYKTKKWKDLFPELIWLKGNHDAIIERKAMTGGLSNKWIRPYNEVLEVPGWKLVERYELDDVQYIHGIGKNAFNRIKSDMQSTVQGHYHTLAGVNWLVGSKFKVFGMQVGCGIDRKAYAMAYGKHFPKPAIGCGLILENGTIAFNEMMKL